MEKMLGGNADWWYGCMIFASLMSSVSIPDEASGSWNGMMKEINVEGGMLYEKDLSSLSFVAQ